MILGGNLLRCRPRLARSRTSAPSHPFNSHLTIDFQPPFALHGLAQVNLTSTLNLPQTFQALFNERFEFTENNLY